ncbi:MAG: ketosteroid isomerase [Terriglobia bacterium]|nr:MAG: ketosteroid isomerase [Terriglobia bacterium]
MSEQGNIQIVQEAYSAFSRGDIPGLLATLTEDVTWTMPGEPEIPFAGKRSGKAGAAEFFRRLNESDEVLNFEPREFFANGDKVVVLGLYRARARATGKIVENDWAHVFGLRSGKISSWIEYCDTASVASAYRQESAAAR